MNTVLAGLTAASGLALVLLSAGPVGWVLIVVGAVWLFKTS